MEKDLIYHEGKIYKRTDRRPAVGDKVLIVNASRGFNEPYGNGDVIEVKEVTRLGIHNEDFSSERNTDGYIIDTEFVVLDLVGTLDPSDRIEDLEQQIIQLEARVEELNDTVGLADFKAGQALTKVGQLKDKAGSGGSDSPKRVVIEYE